MLVLNGPGDGLYSVPTITDSDNRWDLACSGGGGYDLLVGRTCLRQVTGRTAQGIPVVDGNERNLV